MTSAPALDPSAARAAAAELYAAARPAVSMAGMTSAELVGVVEACRATIRSLEAVETLAVARLAATEEVVSEDGTVQEVSQGLGYRRLDAPDLVSAAFGVSAQQASVRVEEAVLLACKTPRLVDAMGAGRIDAWRAGIIATELRDAPRHVCDQVLDRLDASLHQPGGVLRRRTRHHLEQVDKRWLTTTASRARSQVGLRMVPGEDSTDTWTAILPTEQSRQAWAAVEPLAKQIRDAEGVTLDVARARAMTALMLGNCTGTFHLHLVIPEATMNSDAAATTDADPADPADPAKADGGGAGTAGAFTPGSTPEAGHPAATDPDTTPGDDVREAASRAAAADGGLVSADSEAGEWTVVAGLGTAGTTIVPATWLGQLFNGELGSVVADVTGCHPTTGGFSTDPVPITLPTATRSEPPTRRRRPNLTTEAYPPTAAARAYVQARDQHCRFPGCTTSAYHCDLDHVRPWPAGPTTPTNLALLCRRHHRIKQRPGWTARLHPDGTMDWTDPTGTTRTTHPVDHLGTTPTDGHAVGHEAGDLDIDLDDPIWGGDYQDHNAYTGGLPIELIARRDLYATASFIRAFGEPVGWTQQWWNDPPPPLPSDVRWIAS